MLDFKLTNSLKSDDTLDVYQSLDFRKYTFIILSSPVVNCTRFIVQ
jgi:hypothetical protein